ncbi:MAG TPA: hypothetical protein VJ835_01255 [Fimbriimonadaceae bacterium]|nr:hypothetical protein [Fimbriimonadaceae bacterium]
MKRALFSLAVLASLVICSPAQFEGQSRQTGMWSNILSALRPRSLGPTNMGGRIMDIAVYGPRPQLFYVATASGGLWKTENGGTTVKPVFQNETSVGLGAVAVSQKDPNLVWVGTGEASSRNSAIWGDGIYKSTDGGATWKNMGLKETMHIAKIVVDPRDDNTVVVAALGHLWGPNPERGVYRTTDGGKTWSQVLKVDNSTGAADLVQNPKNPNEMLCAMWTRERKAYDFTSGGPGSGLYKSTDGGKTWRKITKGLPDTTIGRIGLSYFYSDPKNVVATVEVKPKDASERQGGTSMNGGAIYLSKDGGESWTRQSNLNPRPFYFSLPRWDPTDINRIYVGGVNLHVSDDMGKTFRALNVAIHADNHALWIDPKDNNTLYIGNDGGTYISRDRAVKWTHVNNIVASQFYAVAFDMRKPYWVYGGLQDNGSWGYPTQTIRGGSSWYDAYNVGGGDGFHVQVDPNDWTTLYSESQGGAVSRQDQKNGGGRSIRPRVATGEPPLRFNWSTPIALSPHNSTTVYIGANKLFKSVNRGDSWKAISPDLTTNDPNKNRPGQNSVSPEDTGAERHCTIITISESPAKPGLIWVGTDDGLIWVTKDDGVNWENVTNNVPDLPKFTWCSRVTASKYVEGRCYATFDGHRNDDFKPYVYVTEDFGKTWSKLDSGLTQGDPAYVIREGLQNPDLLILGSEMSLRFSLDRGKNWVRFVNDFPTVAVHDAIIHPRDQDLVIATHGRGIWTVDISPLEQLTAENMAKDVFVAKPQPVYNLGRMSGTPWDGDAVYLSPNTQPGTTIFYWLKAKATGEVKVSVQDAAGTQITELTGTGTEGLNAVRWNARIRGRIADPGDYRVVVTVGGKEYTTSIKVDKADWLD